MKDASIIWEKAKAHAKAEIDAQPSQLKLRGLKKPPRATANSGRSCTNCSRSSQHPSRQSPHGIVPALKRNMYRGIYI